MKRTILAVLSDTHGGCKVSLMNPNVELYDKDAQGNLKAYKPQPTASQAYLWKTYTRALEQAFEFAGDDEMILFHDGDATHGIRFMSELVSTRTADQIIIACANLRPWFAYPNLKKVRLFAGTGVHVMGEGSSEILIAGQLAAEYPGVDTTIKTHGVFLLDGVIVDCAHHGPHPGSRDWLRGNVARFYLRDLMYREILAHRKPPRLVLRAHYHQPVHEYLEMNGDTAELYILPSWSLLDEHANKAAQSPNEVTNGVTLFEIIDGEIGRTLRLYTKLDVREKEVL